MLLVVSPTLPVRYATNYYTEEVAEIIAKSLPHKNERSISLTTSCRNSTQGKTSSFQSTLNIPLPKIVLQTSSLTSVIL